MGKKIIPFILEELETKKNTIIWNLILQKITNVNPIKEESNFNMNLIADDWICWCKNYLKNVARFLKLTLKNNVKATISMIFFLSDDEWSFYSK